MTIVAAYRIDDRAILVSDFRNTSIDNQTDVSLKFINIGDHIGLFLSGDALFWQRSIPLLQQCSENVTLNNVIDMEGPFYEAISNAFWNQQSVVRTRAIGFVINNDNKTNILFSIDIQPRVGVRILPIEENSCLVIGSGSMIRNIEIRISERVRRDITLYGYDLYTLADSMRKEVQQALVSAGSSSFHKLGISPYMALHSLAGSHFMIRGENIQGEVFTGNAYLSYNYSFVKDETTGEITLEDHQNVRSLTVNSITNLQDALTGDIFDPQQLTLGFDPEQEFPDHHFVHLLHQWVTQNDDNTINVFRSIKRIRFVEIKDRVRISESSNSVIDVREFPEEHLHNYPDCRDQYFFLSDEDDARFMAELNEELLFNHEWLASYIEDYHKVFYFE